jgi:hypothetical protein
MTPFRGTSGRSRDRVDLERSEMLSQSQHKMRAYSMLSKNQLFLPFDHYLATHQRCHKLAV